LKKQSQFVEGRIGVISVIIIAYGILNKWRLLKNKANQSQFAWEAELAQAIPKACGFEAATRRRPAKKKGDLKKQTQFAAAQVDAKSFVKGDYGNMPARGAQKNKANQSQKTGFPPIRLRSEHALSLPNGAGPA
jgi:hypothetical protein